MAIAFFSTWTTYGTWLPGDMRGFRQHGRGGKAGLARWEFEAKLKLVEGAIVLNVAQRLLVEKTIGEHCAHRGWMLHAVNCRTNHVHTVVTAPDRDLRIPREQFMAWCTRKLKEQERAMTGSDQLRQLWWTERGWDEYLDNDNDLADAIAYVNEGQDCEGRLT